MAKKLEPYRAKRDFRVTPEPAPEAPRPRSKGPIFMVHKHDATRLHYDLRLEMDGALASWAIPRGPSYDPTIKRLAVQTEDHPLAYGEFEGRIPDGEYGGGDSLIWDRGTYSTEPPGQESWMRRKGHLALRLDGQKLKGLWHLVRTRPIGGKEQWIFFKGKDELATPEFDVVEQRPESVISGRRVTRGPVSARTLRAPHPSPIQLLVSMWPPMLPRPAKARQIARGDWLFEGLYPGFRALAAISGRKVALQSRGGLDLSGNHPEIAAALSRVIVGEAVLDGTLIALDRDGTPRLDLLAEPGAEVRYVAWDLLWLEREDLRGRPLEDRRDLLESLLSNTPEPVMLAQRVDADAGAALRKAREAGLDGLVARRPGSPYVAGPSDDLLQLRARPSQPVVLIGHVPGARPGDAAHVFVAIEEGDGLRYAGKVAMPPSAGLRRQLAPLLRAGALSEPPAAGAPRARGVRWLEPARVLEVEHAGWAAAGTLRSAKLRALRPDLKPTDCLREPEPAPARIAKPSRRRRPTGRGRRGAA